MADQTVTVATASLTGGTVTSYTITGTNLTLTISANDYRELGILVTNDGSDETATITIESSDDYSSGVIGDATVTIATAATAIIGGPTFDSSRFKDEDGHLHLTFTTLNDCTVRVFKLR